MFNKSVVLLIAAGMLFGCASTRLQSAAIRENPEGLPATHLISNVEFKEQEAGYCGPAVLSMAMQSIGKTAEPANLASQMMTPGLNGTLPADFIGAAKRQGLMAVPVRTFREMLLEISAGNSVVVFENLGLSWYPQWHYALVLGFDLPRNEIILHSGTTPYLRETMKVFENSWKLSDYWGLVVLRPGQLAVSAGERAHVEAAVGLENLGKVNEAALSYQSILLKWPDSLVAAIGLSHFHFKNNEPKKAAQLLLSAQTFHPGSEAIKHNLSVILNGK